MPVQRNSRVEYAQGMPGVAPEFAVNHQRLAVCAQVAQFSKPLLHAQCIELEAGSECCLRPQLAGDTTAIADVDGALADRVSRRIPQQHSAGVVGIGNEKDLSGEALSVPDATAIRQQNAHAVQIVQVQGCKAGCILVQQTEVKTQDVPVALNMIDLCRRDGKRDARASATSNSSN